MSFIYHGVPEQLVGTQLVPLNQMRDDMSDIREKNLKKYDGREEILERKIPLLDCAWNDVLQFLPIHPQKIFELQKSLGLISEIPNYRYYKIELETLDVNETVVFFKTAPGEENTEVKWITDVDVSDLQDIPDATTEYYKSLVGTKQPVFNYQFIPHIVHKGRVDIADLPIITLEQ